MKSLLMRIARSELGGQLLRFILSTATVVFPWPTTYRSKSLIVIRHPAASYPIHFLFIPLPPLSGLQSITSSHNSLLSEILQVSNQITKAHAIPTGWRLVVNGGAYQEVDILHFHLIREDNSSNPSID